MESSLFLGLVAGFITSVAAVPQVIKALRSRSVRDLSLWQPCLLTIGVALWLIYGLVVKDIPLVVMNVVPLLANIVLIYLKITSKTITAVAS